MKDTSLRVPSNATGGLCPPVKLLATQKPAKQNKQPYLTVQHNYKDRANDPVTDDALVDLEAKRNAYVVPFSLKLYHMLERVEQDGYSHIVSWQPHGRCFVIHSNKLIEEILPYYGFKLSQFASFQRQLNLYGFERLTRGLDRTGYYHELFLRGRPYFVPRIQRVKVKGTKVRARSSPDEEPNFWAMPWVGREAVQIPSKLHFSRVCARSNPDEKPNSWSMAGAGQKAAQGPIKLPLASARMKDDPSKSVPAIEEPPEAPSTLPLTGARVEDTRNTSAQPIQPQLNAPVPAVEEAPEDDILMREWGDPVDLESSNLDVDDPFKPIAPIEKIDCSLFDQECRLLLNSDLEDETDFL